MIGASGAVAAVLGAYAVTFPHARVRTLVFLVVFVTLLDVPALVVLGVWFLGQLISAQQALGAAQLSGGVAWWAHVGGFIAGAILMLVSFVSFATRGLNLAIDFTGGAFVPNSNNWPAARKSQYLYADMGCNSIFAIDEANPGAGRTTFGTNEGASHLAFGPDGALYYTDLNSNDVRRIVYTP